MVQFTGATLLALVGAAAAGSAHRAPAHAALHKMKRGDYSTAPEYPYSTSPAASTETTCTEEESTTPAVSTSTYAVVSPSTTPAASTSTYAVSSPAVYSTYVASSPAASTETTCTEEESSSSTYVVSTPVAETSTYVVSTPVAETSTYVVSTPVAETSTYELSTYEASTSPAKSTVISYASTSTSYVLITSTAIYTVTGSTPAASTYPVARSSGHGHGHGPHPSYCGTVTVTVTAGAGETSPAASSSTSTAAASTYEVSSSVAASTYEVSSSVAASTYKVSSYVASSSYVHSSPLAMTTSSVAQTYAVSSPTPSTYAAASPSSGSYSGGKRGLAYASIPELNIGTSSGISWALNWAAQAGQQPSSVEYVPMLKDLTMVSAFQESASSASYLMAMNEVDMTTSGGGTPMSPAQAAQAYQQYLMPYASTHKLGSVSVTSDSSESSYLNGISAASGLDYLTQFAAACEGCQIDFACIHWYGAAGQSASEQAEAFEAYISQAIETVQGLWGANTKVWVTEFSALPLISQDTSGVNEAFMQQVVPWLESQSSIERYSYFAATPGLMANADGSLSQIGQTYASL